MCQRTKGMDQIRMPFVVHSILRFFLYDCCALETSSKNIYPVILFFGVICHYSILSLFACLLSLIHVFCVKRVKILPILSNSFCNSSGRVKTRNKLCANFRWI